MLRLLQFNNRVALSPCNRPLYALIEAYKHIDPLMLPRWRSLPENLKQVFRMAACGNHENSYSLSCNLGPKTVDRAMKASRGAPDYLGRKLRDVLQRFCSAEEIALVVENVNRQGMNSGIHFHAVIRVSEDQLPQLKDELTKAFASDYKEVCLNEAVHIQPIYGPGGWAGYCNKLRYENDNLGKRFFATNKASQAGEKLFREFISWQRNLHITLKHPDELRAEVRKLITGSAEPRSCPELMQLIQQHKARQERMRLWRRERNKHYRLLAANDQQFVPDVHSQQLSDRAFDAAKIPAETLLELSGEANRAGSYVRSYSRQNELAERYSEHPEFGLWGASNDEDEPLFGYHTEPES